MLDELLVKILICPNCKGPTEYRAADDLIVCVGECRYEYSVIDDVPNMLVEEARKPRRNPEP